MGDRSYASQNPTYTYNLSSTDAPFDLSKATLGKYRFFRCSSLIKNNIIEIYEYEDFPSEPYSIVSYVWDGVKPDPQVKYPKFSVKTKYNEKYKTDLAGDPINIEVIRDACYAAQKHDTDLLWLDRLTVIQASEDDTSWQFANMCNIYRRSTVCIVIPGGLAQLTPLDKVTPWINRGWTLQEAVAPAKVEVLFSWTRGEYEAKPLATSQVSGHITQVTKGRSALAPLWLLLDSAITGLLLLTSQHDNSQTETLDDEIKMFGIVSKRNASDYSTLPPSITMLAAALSQRLVEDKDHIYHCLWKCMLMRVTRDPADLIFSVMGLFNVTLNTKDFPNKDSCIRPAIALAREILKQGHGATWLGASFHAPPCRQVSTFPAFPRFQSSGTKKALIRIRGGAYVSASALMLNEYVNSKIWPMPRGEMDEEGYFTFKAKCVPVIRARVGTGLASPETVHQEQPIRRLVDTNRVVWLENSDLGTPQDTFAVLLGVFFMYDPTTTPTYDYDNLRGFIVKSNSQGPRPETFQIESYFMLPVATKSWIKEWKRKDLCVGGPDPLASEDLSADIKEVAPEDMLLPQADENIRFTSIEIEDGEELDAEPAKQSRRAEVPRKLPTIAVKNVSDALSGSRFERKSGWAGGFSRKNAMRDAGPVSKKTYGPTAKWTPEDLIALSRDADDSPTD